MNGKTKKTLMISDFTYPSYEEVKEKIIKKTGQIPALPADLPKGDWSEQALKVLEERYLRRDEEGTIYETPEDLCWRVSWEVASAEARWGGNKIKVTKRACDFYDLLVTKKFLPNSPTLMNAGAENSMQYSGCFVLPVDDSLVGIFDAIKYQAIIHQTGGGTGFSFSRLRPRGSMVKSSRGTASGPISFMRIFDAATNEIKQGGKRRGANMGILRVDHPDIMEFIHCKEAGGITNFNISVAITSDFMKAYEKGEEYDLIDPKKGVKVGSLSAKKVFDGIADAAWRTGDPGLIFIDKINDGLANPVRSLGPIEATNPCVTGDTLVSTKEGLVKMKEVVESHFEGGKRYGGNMGLFIDKRATERNESGVLESRAVDFFDVGVRKVFKLITKSGLELTATRNHRVLTSRGWVELGKLNAGDKVLIQSGKGNFGQDNNLPFTPDKGYPTRWSKELGQVLGWLIGDGWLRTDDKNCRVGFTFGEKDSDILKSFSTIINHWYGKEIKCIKRLRNTYHLSYHGLKSVNFFLKLGVKPVKAEAKSVPESIFVAPEEAVIGFLQGLFSADGTVRDSRKSNSDWIALTSKSRLLLQGVQLLLLNLGIKSRIFDRSRESRSGMFPYKAKDGSLRTYTLDGILYELGIFGDFREKFKEEIGFLNKYKQNRLKKTRTRVSRRLKDAYTDIVLAVKELGRQRVYDVTEPTSHSIIANGFVVHQCGEQPLYPYDTCNLGSIFLNYLVKEEVGKLKVDWDELGRVVKLAVRFLDDVIEVNPFPLKVIRDTALSIRRIGLGVGGWADLLTILNIPYDSEEALDLAEKIMRFIEKEAVSCSEELASERGVFPMFKESIFKDEKPRRNSAITTIAPTGSISIIAGASSGIEPLFAICYRHIVKDKSLDRTLTFFNSEFEEKMRQRGLWNDDLKEKVSQHGVVREIEGIPDDIKQIFGTAHEIAYEWHIKTQAVFQKYTDNAVSKTINLKSSATIDDVKYAYLQAWKSNCKGITVFRDGCKDAQVLNLGLKDKEGEDKVALIPTQTRPFRVQGATYKLQTPVGTAFVTINQDQNGEPLELFINVGKAGSDVTAMAEALGRSISTAIRFHGTLRPIERAKEIAVQLAGIGGRRSVGFGPNKILSLPDAIAAALSLHFGFKVNGFTKMTGASALTNGDYQNGQVKAESSVKEMLNLNEFLAQASMEADICPSCGASAFVYEEGCSKCHACGNSEC